MPRGIGYGRGRRRFGQKKRFARRMRGRVRSAIRGALARRIGRRM